MSVINPVSLETASFDQKKILEGIKAKMGKVPNIYATIVHSPTTLEAMMGYSVGLKKGVLTPQEIESIALAVAQKNSCDYCLAAHTLMGKAAGLSPEDMLLARKEAAADPKRQVLVKLAVEITETKGRPTHKSLEAFRKAGYSDAALVEVVAWVTFNIFTNYINHVAETEIDFPEAPEIK
ncbi:MAG: carboxymuconolactone decarboxylase family protein [Candidatus Omnitrophica bacterium]|nr:carboxymuconolactone decarboxylase family protein [Candidatus Omnitrophota bacterium]